MRPARVQGLRCPIHPPPQTWPEPHHRGKRVGKIHALRGDSLRPLRLPLLLCLSQLVLSRGMPDSPGLFHTSGAFSHPEGLYPPLRRSLLLGPRTATSRRPPSQMGHETVTATELSFRKLGKYSLS